MTQFKKWNTKELQILKKNYGMKIAKKIGVTTTTADKIIRNLIKKNINSFKFSEQQKDILLRRNKIIFP